MRLNCDQVALNTRNLHACTCCKDDDGIAPKAFLLESFCYVSHSFIHCADHTCKTSVNSAVLWYEVRFPFPRLHSHQCSEIVWISLKKKVPDFSPANVLLLLSAIHLYGTVYSSGTCKGSCTAWYGRKRNRGCKPRENAKWEKLQATNIWFIKSFWNWQTIPLQGHVLLQSVGLSLWKGEWSIPCCCTRLCHFRESQPHRSALLLSILGRPHISNGCNNPLDWRNNLVIGAEKKTMNGWKSKGKKQDTGLITKTHVWAKTLSIYGSLEVALVWIQNFCSISFSFRKHTVKRIKPSVDWNELLLPKPDVPFANAVCGVTSLFQFVSDCHVFFG